MRASHALRHVPGCERHLARLVDLCSSGSPGRLVFVGGDRSTGRGLLLRALADHTWAADPRPRVLAGGMVGGSFVSWNDDGDSIATVAASLRRMGSAGEKIASALGDVGVPLAGLVAKALTIGSVPLDLFEGFVGRHPCEVSDITPRVLRALCEEGPVLCIIDDADQAATAGLWADLILGLARSAVRDLPLMLVIGLDGPQQLGSHEEDEPDGLNVARQLSDAGLASWYSVGPVDLNDLRSYTGRATPDVLSALLEITEGQAIWAGHLWQDWRRRGVIEDVSQGSWRFASGRLDAAEDVDDMLSRRLKQLIGDDVSALDRSKTLLACAALEGRRFTAVAVAAALGLEDDEVIDFIDERLVVDQQPHDGVVVEDGWVRVSDESGTRALAMYRFVRELDWLVLARRSYLTDREQRSLGGRLANALVAQHGGQTPRIAHALTRLYSIAQLPERARHFRRMADIGTSKPVIVWRAHRILGGDEPTDPGERLRCSSPLRTRSFTAVPTGTASPLPRPRIGSPR